jgi:Na+/glutamate symporter
MSPNAIWAGGGGVVAGSKVLNQWVQLCTCSPNNLWTSIPIFTLCLSATLVVRAIAFTSLLLCLSKTNKLKIINSSWLWYIQRCLEMIYKLWTLYKNKLQKFSYLAMAFGCSPFVISITARKVQTLFDNSYSCQYSLQLNISATAVDTARPFNLPSQYKTCSPAPLSPS